MKNLTELELNEMIRINKILITKLKLTKSTKPINEIIENTKLELIKYNLK